MMCIVRGVYTDSPDHINVALDFPSEAGLAETTAVQYSAGRDLQSCHAGMLYFASSLCREVIESMVCLTDDANDKVITGQWSSQSERTMIDFDEH